MTGPALPVLDLTALGEAILDVEGVARLHGRRLSGLLGEQAAHVHLVLYEGCELGVVADTVRKLVAARIGREPQDVVIAIEDLAPQPPTDQETS